MRSRKAGAVRNLSLSTLLGFYGVRRKGNVMRGSEVQRSGKLEALIAC